MLIINNEKLLPGRTNSSDITVFKALGMGLYDATVVKLILDLLASRR